MRNALSGVVAVAALAAGGCLLPPLRPEAKAPPPNESLAARPAVRSKAPTVRPEAVNEENAHDVAKALGDEIRSETDAEKR